MFHVKHEKAPNDTIAAIITPIGIGGVGIVRISGEKAQTILHKVFVSQNNSTSNIKSHTLRHGWINSKRQAGPRLDEVLVSYLKGPNSYTGEDVVEISGHGGALVLRRVLERVLSCGARTALPGEFTRRAFLNGKMDLVKAEAVIDLIAAKSDMALSAAAAQLAGRLGQRIEKIRERLMGILLRLEAAIDFPEDIDEEAGGTTRKALIMAQKEIDVLLAGAEDGRALRDGYRVAIIGKPNVGKSSLLNAMIMEERAIVTEVPGTTRDAIEEVISIEGLPIVVVDTAGQGRAKDAAEKKSIERAQEEEKDATLTLIVIDGAAGVNGADISIMEKANKRKAMIIINKKDLGEKIKAKQLPFKIKTKSVSALTGDGIEELKKEIVKRVVGKGIKAVDNGLISVRHKECLDRAKASLKRAIEACGDDLGVDFITIDIRNAINGLDEVSGREISDEIVNKIFGRFCVGK